MSKYNTYANEDKYRSIVSDYVHANCPLVWIFAPSNEGKTTLLGSLFPRDPAVKESVPLWSYEHDDFCKVLYIDADQGTATIGHFTSNEALCDFRGFDQLAKEQLAWTYKQLDEASTAECGAIVIEGMTSVHKRLVTNALRKKPGAEGNELRRCYIGASSHAQGLIDCVRQVKQNRIARKNGVPIFVTCNTKSQPIDPEKPDSGIRHVPDWSPNLVEAAMRGSDGHLQLKRDATGTRLISRRIPGPHPYCKMRNDDVAKAVERETNLNLPGLLTLWAVTTHTKAAAVAAARAKQESNQTPSE